MNGGTEINFYSKNKFPPWGSTQKGASSLLMNILLHNPLKASRLLMPSLRKPVLPVTHSALPLCFPAVPLLLLPRGEARPAVEVAAVCNFQVRV